VTNRQWNTIFSILGLAILLIQAPALLGADESARTVSSADEISWQVSSPFASADLTVSGPDGRVNSFHFKEGDPLRLRVADLPVGALDGSYVFELRLNPHHRLRTRGVEPSRMDATDARRGAMSRPEEAGLSKVLAGSFTLQAGLVVNPSSEEEASPQTLSGKSAETSTKGDGVVAQPEAQVIVDNLVVQASACFGTDCTNTEVFGFDTVRLKENNTRIKFDDTSNSGSFPFTDWQLTANESNNGGLNKFSIEDVTNSRIPFTVLAGSPTNSFFIDNAGRLGLRTSTPAVNLHMKVGNTPTMRLDQDGTLGFLPQAWDIGGNEVSFFIRNANNGTMMLEILPGGNWTTSSGASLTGGAWTNASSATLKQDIADLDPTLAIATVRDLRPVTFEYKSSPDEQSVGFIAEEVPDLVATNDRKGLSAMDVVAVLTKVVQEQQKTIDELSRRIEQLERNGNDQR